MFELDLARKFNVASRFIINLGLHSFLEYNLVSDIFVILQRFFYCLHCNCWVKNAAASVQTYDFVSASAKIKSFTWLEDSSFAWLQLLHLLLDFSYFLSFLTGYGRDFVGLLQKRQGQGLVSSDLHWIQYVQWYQNLNSIISYLGSPQTMNTFILFLVHF